MYDCLYFSVCISIALHSHIQVVSSMTSISEINADLNVGILNQKRNISFSILFHRDIILNQSVFCTFSCHVIINLATTFLKFITFMWSGFFVQHTLTLLVSSLHITSIHIFSLIWSINLCICSTFMLKIVLYGFLKGTLSFVQIKKLWFSDIHTLCMMRLAARNFKTLFLLKIAKYQ